MKNRIFFLGFCFLFFIGCATSSMYVHYTSKHFVPKDKLYDVKIYLETEPLNASKPYFVIGKVLIEGFSSNGVGTEGLTKEAKEIARKRGADAIINVKSQVFRYYDGDNLFKFNGELIVYSSSATQ